VGRVAINYDSREDTVRTAFEEPPPLTGQNTGERHGFSKRRKDAANEEAQAQSFIAAFLQVFGIGDPLSVGEFEFRMAFSDE